MTPLEEKTEAARLIDELIAKGLTGAEISVILGAAFVDATVRTCSPESLASALAIQIRGVTLYSAIALADAQEKRH